MLSSYDDILFRYNIQKRSQLQKCMNVPSVMSSQQMSRFFFYDTVYLQIRIPNNNPKDSKDIDEKTMK